ncbi:MAG: DEAD/DEAH box helicase [Desulfatibacillaceae bacterium]|nr:DEAD/DEAH box helicase [Desulfatibacillaceae bacterium]
MPLDQDPLPAQTPGRAPQFLTNILFEDFSLDSRILSGLGDLGFSRCSPIQAQVLPVALKGGDVAGQAQTGTGKTAAFLVPLIQALLHIEDRDPKMPSALVVAPTRELAIQIYEEASVLVKHTGLSLAWVVGGMEYKKQADDLKSGADIVVGTPGRIIDYYKQGILNFAKIRVAVIDEADRLLDLGFAKDMRFILKKLPHFSSRQTMLFSATLSYRVLELTYDYMNLPEFIAVTPDVVMVQGISQELYHVGQEEKLPLLLGLLEREDWSRLLIFVNTKSGVEWLAAKLTGNGLPAGAITGDLPQKKRLKLMQQFKDGEVSILVATDVASRGIHVEDISHVINYDLPQDPENYIHRIGRTARAGKTGRALTLACESYVFYLESVEALLGKPIPVVWSEPEWLKPDKAGPVHSSRRRKSSEKARKRIAPKKAARPGLQQAQTSEKPKKPRRPRRKRKEPSGAGEQAS